MKNLRIGTRLALGFGSIVILILFMTVLSLTSAARVEKSVEEIARGSYLKAAAANSALIQIQSVLRSMDMIVILKGRHEDQLVEQRKIEAARVKYRAAMQTLAMMEKSPRGMDIFARMKATVKQAAGADDKVIELALAGRNEEAAEVLRSVSYPLINKLFVTFDEMDAYQDERVAERYQLAVASYGATRNTLLAIAAVLILVAVASGIAITRSITRPVSNMLAMLKDISSGHGDLTKRLEISAKDEIGETSRYFNSFVERLHGIISHVTRTTGEVAVAANQLDATSAKMANGVEEAALQTNTVANAGEEMAATSGEIAQNCQQAAEGARNAHRAANRGAEVMEKTVAVMEQIAERVQETAATVGSLGARSDQIGAIIGTIEEIADQTNLLALNAAIEAARAGDQGRGFAVVADEVRALAVRTTRATREIGEMIKAIQAETRGAVAAMEQGVKQVETGTSEAAKSGAAIQEILEQVNQVSAQVEQIAAAAEQQTATTCEISSNAQQISSVVQQTANGAQESAQAAKRLSTLSEELRGLMGQFRLA